MRSIAVRPDIFTAFSHLAAAQSTRHEGVSKAPYDTLNLGKSTEDDPADVSENRRLICATLGFVPEQMAWSRQVHGEEIRLVTGPGGAEGHDALVSGATGVLLAVSVADCTPILVYDHANRAIAAIHAGWRGTVAGLVGKTLSFMEQHFGTRGPDCFAYVGACIDECSFEVGEEVADKFSATFKRFDPARGKFMVDLKKANAAQLHAFGIPENQLEISPYCTLRDADIFFSHRHSGGITGRGMGLIGLR